MRVLTPRLSGTKRSHHWAGRAGSAHLPARGARRGDRPAEKL